MKISLLGFVLGRDFWLFLASGAAGLMVLEVPLILLSPRGVPGALVVLVPFLEASIIVNFILNDRFTFGSDRLKRNVKSRFFSFQGQTVVSRGINLAVFALLIGRGVLSPLSELIAVALAFGFNWLVGRHFTWGRKVD